MSNSQASKLATEFLDKFKAGAEASKAREPKAGPGGYKPFKRDNRGYKKHKGRFRGYNHLHRGFELSFLIAYFVWKNPNQNFKVLITGGTGRGKSDLALYLAVGVACWFSIFRYGSPGRWKEFFNYDGTWDLEKDAVNAEYKYKDALANACKSMTSEPLKQLASRVAEYFARIRMDRGMVSTIESLERIDDTYIYAKNKDALAREADELEVLYRGALNDLLAGAEGDSRRIVEKLVELEKQARELRAQCQPIIDEKRKTLVSKNLIVIDKKKMLGVVDAEETDLPKYSVLVLDEVQEIANAIDYKDLETRLFNRLNQVMRDNGYVIFATIQEQIVHTKQSRNLYHVVIDMGDLDGFELSLNFSKTFYIMVKGMINSASKAQWRKYPREHGKKYVMGVNGLAPPSVRDYYMRLRKLEKKDANRRSREDIEKEQKIKNARYAKAVGESRKDKAKHILIEHPEWTNMKIAGEAGLSDGSIVSRLRTELGLNKRPPV